MLRKNEPKLLFHTSSLRSNVSVVFTVWIVENALRSRRPYESPKKESSMRKCLSRFLASYLTAILICLLAAPRQVTLAQASLFHSNTVQPRPVNLDFELGAVGQIPEGWDSPTKAGYAAELNEEHAKSGKRAALLRDVPGAGNSAPFGILMQAIDAASLRGHRVRFRAA